MRKIKLNVLKRILPFALCACILISVPIISIRYNNGNATVENETIMLDVWQIDSFEGGRGSRTAYLQNVADDFSKETGYFLNVKALSADSARLNLSNGYVPDLISYGAGIYGIESYIRGDTPYFTWCKGGYCLLTLESNSNFSDISEKNTVINIGTDNLSGAAAMLCGLSSALTDKPTGAYVKLINGSYKYLLGTQRDIYRLKTRGVSFSVKPLTEFNDLYQNISVTTTDGLRASAARKFIEFLLEKSEGITKLGLMYEGLNLYDDESSVMEGLTYDYKLIAPVSEAIRNELVSAIANNDENKLKNLLK